MNPRRVHELMRRHFPALDAAAQEWVNIADRDGPNVLLLASVVRRFITSEEVLVEIHRKEGALLPLEEVVQYIAAHIGQAEIRLADREFRSAVVIATNGVATGWQVGA
jgi:hypothetical protein